MRTPSSIVRLLPSKLAVLLREIGELADQVGVQAFAVGGLVRDLLLGRANWDVDITVEGDGMAFARILADRYQAGLKIFDRFATALVVLPEGVKLDVATARRESYARPAALPAVEPSSIRQDLYRRDFTINALAIALNAHRFGELIDFYGGQDHLRMKTIRVLHERSFVDDPTRLFRAIRFEQRFGFRIEKRTLSLLKEAAATDLIQRLSGPRFRNEIMRLLSEQNPARSVRRMAELNLFRFLHSRLTLTSSTNALLGDMPTAIKWWERRFPQRPLDRPLAYLMVLVHGLSASETEVVLKRLTLPGSQTSKMKMVSRHLKPAWRALAKNRRMKPSLIYRLLSGLPSEGCAFLVAKAKSAGNTNRGREVKHLVSSHLTTYADVKPSLTGTDLQAMGLKPGPLFRTILDRLLDARLNGDVHTDAEEKDLVRRLAQLS